MKKTHSIDDICTKPQFGLKKDDVLDEYAGLDWIFLECITCQEWNKFVPVSSATSVRNSAGTERAIHYLAKCLKCGEIIYVRCSEYDDDHDYYFDYEMHYPRFSSALLNSKSDDELSLIREAFACYQIGAYRALKLIIMELFKFLEAKQNIEVCDSMINFELADIPPLGVISEQQARQMLQYACQVINSTFWKAPN